MNQHRDLELAGYLAEHGAAILGQCRGIPVAALRRYLKARKNQCDEWLEKLNHPALIGHEPEVDAPVRPWAELRQTIEDIARSGILIRVASAVLHAVGTRLDIPLAIDVAGQTVRAHQGVVQRAMALVTVRTDCPDTQLATLDQLGRVADRLSDLLGGALWPALQCDRFFVDRRRALDFAGTYGRNPRLVRVPVQKVLQGWVQIRTRTAEEVEQSLVACLPNTSNSTARASKDHTQGGRRLRIVAAREPEEPATRRNVALPLSFTGYSFARSRRRLKGAGPE